MGHVIFGMVMSLDGFINDANGSVARLYPNMEAMRETSDMQEAMETTGAVVMGRHSYDMAQGDFTGYEFQVPLFVVTHEPPETVAKGENDKLSFTFVTDGVSSAIEKAKVAAGDKHVTVVGGANVFQQLLNAGLIDEIHIDLRPLLLTQGLRLFDHLKAEHVELEHISIVAADGVTHMKFRVVK